MNPVKRTSFQLRMLCSILAIAISWFVAGSVFVMVVHGPARLSAWLIWGTGCCLTGWVLVGIPVAASREWVFRERPGLFAVLVGFCGALVMALPYLAWVFTQGSARETPSMRHRTHSGIWMGAHS